jgi:glycosyltransferase involved in cell wall biosynthesis
MVTPMRVLVISHAYLTAENRRTLEELGRLAVVRALVPDSGPDISGAQRPARSDARGYELIPLPIGGSLLTGTRWYFKSCASAWRGFDPDVVLIAQEVWSLALLQGLICRIRFAPKSKLAVFTWESQARPGWKGGLSSCFYRLAVSSASVILTGNRDTRRIFLRHGADPRRIFVMPLVGLDPDRLHPVDDGTRRRRRRALELREEAFTVGYAGRLVPEKGVLDLADAVDRLGSGVQLAILGAGSMESELRARRDRGSPIVLLPPVPRHEIAPFYQSLDVFVLPSRTTPTWKEQFGMVAAEAMACGLPVVGSSSGAIPDVLGGSGAIFPEGDVGALGSTLARLRNDPALRANLGRAAGNRSRRFFSHASLANQTREVFDFALKRRRSVESAQYCDIP